MSYEVNGKEVSKEEYIAFLKKHSKAKWFECPLNEGNEVSMLACMTCPYGHMLECHYPFDCSTAYCEHYQQELRNSLYYEEEG